MAIRNMDPIRQMERTIRNLQNENRLKIIALNSAQREVETLRRELDEIRKKISEVTEL